MSVIFPGNYVAHLNAYRDQGVVALPGVEFYRVVGAVVINPDSNSITDADGSLAAETYPVFVLSPDLRQDDKPRKDKPLTIPAGAVVYRSALSAPGCKGADGDKITIETIANAPASVDLVAASDGFYPEEGAVTALPSILDGTVVSAGSDTPVEVTTDGTIYPELKPSAGACRKSPSAIIVEICYYVPAPAPSYDDAHIPYAVEAGQGY